MTTSVANAVDNNVAGKIQTVGGGGSLVQSANFRYVSLETSNLTYAEVSRSEVGDR